MSLQTINNKPRGGMCQIIVHTASMAHTIITSQRHGDVMLSKLYGDRDLMDGDLITKAGIDMMICDDKLTIVHSLQVSPSIIAHQIGMENK